MVTDTVRQFLCGLQGHEEMLSIGVNRISLICHSCGWSSDGWDLRHDVNAEHVPVARANPVVIRGPWDYRGKFTANS